MNFYSDDENDYHIIDHLNFSPEKFKINLISLKGGGQLNVGAPEFKTSQSIVQPVPQTIDIAYLESIYKKYQVEFVKFCEEVESLGITSEKLEDPTNIKEMLKHDNFKEILKSGLKIKEKLFFNFERNILQLLDVKYNPVEKYNVDKLWEIFEFIPVRNQNTYLTNKFLILIYKKVFDNEFQIDEYLQFVNNDILNDFLSKVQSDDRKYITSDIIIDDNNEEVYYVTIEGKKLLVQDIFKNYLKLSNDNVPEPVGAIVPVGTSDNHSDVNSDSDDGLVSDDDDGLVSQDDDGSNVDSDADFV